MRILFSLCLIITVCACIKLPQHLTLDKVNYSDLRNWQQGNHQKALQAFEKSCEKFATLDDNYWKDVCTRIPNNSKQTKLSARKFFEDNFSLFAASNRGDKIGLFTGYYVPELNGSMTKTKRFKYPVYRMPDDNIAPKFTRKEINEGALNSAGLELLYVDNKIDLFFMHIQGSGRINLDNGKIIRVGYDGQNGRKYKSIGRHMIHEGLMEKDEVTAQSLKDWLRSHPTKIDSILNENPSYIFLRILEGHKDNGPIGSQGVELTAYYSLAVDNKFIAYGTPIWLETKIPDDKKYHQLMIAQDSGGAIKGAVRGDIFFGYGKLAEQQSGQMKADGKYYILLPNDIVK